MGARIFLVLSALVWLPYGLFCLFFPPIVGETAGILVQSATGVTELRAMYGGLQIGLGALALSGALRAALTRPALLALAFLCAGLGSARLLGTVFDGGVSSYTIAGLAFEFLSAGLAIRFLRRTSPA